MSEWWTYSLSDFLMFSSRSYYRLFALYNEALWPAHLLAIAVGVVVIGCIAVAQHKTYRIAALVMAISWAWVAWAYHLERYADINTAGPYFAAAFALQAVLLCFAALRPPVTAPSRAAQLLGSWFAALAVLVYPLLALANDREWLQAEVFGMAPDPTVVATLAVLLAWRVHWHLWLIPVAWCLASGATLMELGVGHAWLLPTLALSTGALGLWPARRINSTTNSPT